MNTQTISKFKTIKTVLQTLNSHRALKASQGFDCVMAKRNIVKGVLAQFGMTANLNPLKQ